MSKRLKWVYPLSVMGGGGKPLSMRPAADDDLNLTLETLEQGVKYVQS